MQIRPLAIEGAFELTPRKLVDDRGLFMEWFKGDALAEAAGHRFNLAQANCSVSAAGVLRGIHFADVPPGQAKYVTCTSGAVLDVVVDIRVGSSTFGTWDSVLLDDVDRRAVYLTVGLGHAFMALEDRSSVMYLCSTAYAPGREHSVHPLDSNIGIRWPHTERDGTALTPLLSERDSAAPSLARARAEGTLPSMEQCRRA